MISQIIVQKTYGLSSDAISNVSDFVLFYAKRRDMLKVRPLYREKPYELGKGNATWLLHPDFTYRGVNSFEKDGGAKIPEGAKPYNPDNLLSRGRASEPQPFEYRGLSLDPFINEFTLEVKLSSWNEQATQSRANTRCGEKLSLPALPHPFTHIFNLFRTRFSPSPNAGLDSTTGFALQCL